MGGQGDVEVTNVQIDSRRCRKNSCFVAIRGLKDDGHQYIRSAVKAGAKAVVLCEPAELPGSWVVVDDTREAAGRLAQAIRGFPARKLKCIGVTGTNGKTTVAHMIRSVLQEAGLSSGLLGTIQYETGKRVEPALTTTPDPIALAEMTAEMLAAGKTHLVMEVSSHALDQRRLAGLEFDSAVYTNLSGDHLDYHGDMESYLGAKLRLFAQLDSHARAILNRDDPYADRFAAETRAAVTWYGLSSAADVHARIESIDVDGCRLRLICEGTEMQAETSMIGRHNVQNYLAAVAASRAMGVELPTIVEALRRVDRVPGRIERINIDAAYRVFVDYAHTDDALRNVLSSLRPVVKGRIIVVFGCGGDRDRTKRPRMGHIAEQFADRIVITSDNPRSEDPEAIIAEISSGLTDSGRTKTEIRTDRREAIELAIHQATEGDLVLIAGKGHETYQSIAGKHIDFDDVKVAREVVLAREGIA